MPTYQQTLHKFLTDSTRRGPRAKIGDYVLYLNPDTISGVKERSHLVYVTLQGGGDFRRTTKPEVWKLAGHTGIKGADELERMYGRVAPTDTKREDLLPFTFPPLFLNTLYVLVNSFTRGMSNSRHLYSTFDMEIQVMPRPRPPSFKRIASTAAAANSTGISAPTSTITPGLLGSP